MARGVAQPKHTNEERLEIGFRICEIYESQWSTVESCCSSVGITDRTFYLWCAQLSELSERYKKAKKVSEENYFEERLKPKVMRSLEKLVDGFDEEKEVTKDLSFQGKPTGEKEVVVTKTRVAPNPTSVIFGMKVVFPERCIERQAVEHTGKDGGAIRHDFSAISNEEMEVMAAMIAKTEQHGGST